ncbi:glycosyltransferase family 25 protein [Paracoccaceae bacterium Fryx2]|nr:glycosyltransferase family 25 protein [Paracoccaceae bacterium Fryx2]
MRVMVINLAGQTARLAFQAGQLDRLGLPWQRVEAVTPATLSPPSDAPYWQRWERPLSPAEKACAASHRAVWARVAAGFGPVLVLEDDALLLPGVADFLARVTGFQGVDHISLETRGRRKLLGAPHPQAPMRRLWQDRSGAAAYVLWPAGAARLLARADRRAGIADAVICAAYDMSSWQADPALAIQIDQCARYGIPPPCPPTRAASAHRARRRWREWLRGCGPAFACAGWRRSCAWVCAGFR